MARAGRPRSFRACGLTPQEGAIMDLFDSGLSFDEIAARLKIQRKTVQVCVSHFNGAPDANDAKWSADLRGASAALLTRIRAVHGGHQA